MRYHSTPAAGAFQFPPKSPRNDPSNVIFATFPTILAMFCMPARGPVGVRLGPKSGPAHPQGSPQGPQRVWGDSRKKSFFSIPGYPKPASRTEAIVWAGSPACTSFARQRAGMQGVTCAGAAPGKSHQAGSHSTVRVVGWLACGHVCCELARGQLQRVWAGPRALRKRISQLAACNMTFFGRFTERAGRELES